MACPPSNHHSCDSTFATTFAAGRWNSVLSEVPSCYDFVGGGLVSSLQVEHVV